MSKLNITPGQWKFSISDNGRHQISGKDGKQICMMWNCKERNSNAHLIAAAPEMYEMLQRMNRYFVEHSVIHNEIEALLSKARGDK
jgi:hypothetical protein